jgi:hypothetical protein
LFKLAVVEGVSKYNPYFGLLLMVVGLTAGREGVSSRISKCNRSESCLYLTAACECAVLIFDYYRQEQPPRLEFESADIADRLPIPWAEETTLVGGGALERVSVVDGRAAYQECVRPGGTTIVPQGSRQGVGIGP